MQQDTPYDNGLPSHFPEKDKVPFCDPWPQSRSTVKLPSLDSPTWIAVATFLLSERKDSGNRRVNRSSVKPFAKYFGLERVCGINKALKRFQKRFQENIGPNEEIEMGCACSSRGASPPLLQRNPLPLLTPSPSEPESADRILKFSLGARLSRRPWA